ncbi:MAG: hypothetical protein ABSH46_18730 [Bryobacteraceae bacterium]
MKHPAETALALYAGGDLGWWTRLGIGRHVRQCGPCRRQVEEFRTVCEMLQAEREKLPPNLEWSEAAAAMRANIRLGIAAGECVAEPERMRSPWRPALALPVLLLIVAGWILQSLPPAAKRASAPERAGGALVLDASPAGIGVERDGRGFQLLRPAAAESVEVSVRGDSVRSRYVDSETGQVTISHVYAE